MQMDILPRDLGELDEIVSGVEADGKGVPVLLRQYLKLGGRLAGFNVDHKFCDSLDGLIIIDLQRVPAHVLDRVLRGSGSSKSVIA
jgi:hypothetical protein